jgi:hypothetical protein
MCLDIQSIINLYPFFPAEKLLAWAGLISRQMLQKLVLSRELAPAKRERLEQELRHARRVEFTIMTAKGQDKGHAIVADDLRDEDGRPVDFLLPQDTKRGRLRQTQHKLC